MCSGVPNFVIAFQAFSANVLEEYMFTLSQTKVLIIDDERAIANSLAFILDLEGFATRIAYSGEEGIELAYTFRPDILVSDVFMGGMTGLEAAIKVKARIPSCKILLLSADVFKAEELYDRFDDRRRFEILAKPIHPLDLLARLRSLVRSLRLEGTGA